MAGYGLKIMKTAQKLALGLGALTSLATLASTAHAQASSSATASGNATILAPLTANKTSDLAFGTIIRPNSGTATVTIDNAGTRTVTGGASVGGSPTAASFQIIGEGGSAYSVSVPSSFDMTAGTSTLTVATTNSSGGGGTLSGSVGSVSTASFGVGGSINVSTATVAGAYTGNLTITAAYN